jgi:hypothetical protein
MERPEEALQIAAVAYLNAALTKPWFCHHIPNGGFRTKVEAGKFKRMGVLPGMPDLLVWGQRLDEVIVKGVSVNALRPVVIAIEFKAPPKRLPSGNLSKARAVLSPAQRARQADLGACGVPYLVIDDMADMVQSLRALGVPLKGRVL